MWNYASEKPLSNQTFKKNLEILDNYSKRKFKTLNSFFFTRNCHGNIFNSLNKEFSMSLRFSRISFWKLNTNQTNCTWENIWRNQKWRLNNEDSRFSTFRSDDNVSIWSIVLENTNKSQKSFYLIFISRVGKWTSTKSSKVLFVCSQNFTLLHVRTFLTRANKSKTFS